jgi:uncharacterized repeat protein (TIGR03803 family)
MARTYVLIRRVVTAVALVLGLAVAAATQTESILYSFTGGNDGGAPYGGLTPDGKGNFFGTAAVGGTDGGGVVFELSPNSSGGWTEQVIYNFIGISNAGDGISPTSTPIFDSKGNLYGVTAAGGTAFQGTIFELTPGSNGAWTEKILHSFLGGPSDGAQPYDGGIVLDGSGDIYGTTNLGGAFGFGTVFELVAGANGTYTEKILHSFESENDGGSPIGSTPILDSAGNLYGVTNGGGTHDYGVVYELSPASNGSWTEKTIYSFTGAGGFYPSGNLTWNSSGDLFGTSKYTAFELSPGTKGRWTEKILHKFTGGTDGANAQAGMVFDTAGNLYGMTTEGGAHRGTIYEMSPESGGTWTEKILHSFAANGIDGVSPQFATVYVDSSGDVFGTTPSGGTSNEGVIFEIKP